MTPFTSGFDEGCDCLRRFSDQIEAASASNYRFDDYELDIVDMSIDVKSELQVDIVMTLEIPSPVDLVGNEDNEVLGTIEAARSDHRYEVARASREVPWRVTEIWPLDIPD